MCVLSNFYFFVLDDDGKSEQKLYREALTEYTTYYFDFETFISRKRKLKVDLAVCHAAGSDIPKIFIGTDAVDQMMNFFLTEKPVTPRLLMAHNFSNNIDNFLLNLCFQKLKCEN